MSYENIEYQKIPLKSGINLAARIWMPERAKQEPLPAILEYIPYRRRDNTRARDESMHPFMAKNGYVSIRVDIRGSGDSEGVLEDEYLKSELDDGLEIIEWIANQEWCNGNVGMVGISWGGFNALQIAALKPKALKAIITVASTDDRYTDDVHHMGGCLLTENLSWASTMFAFNSLPPDPMIVGEKWRDMWFERLKGSGLWLQKWLEHQRRDEYWKHGSINEDWTAIECPVFAISGWADGYTNSVFRLLSNLKVPKLGLVGPWSHRYPHQGVPGPAIGFLHEALRWWDKWLKGKENTIMEEPMLRTWMQEPMPPSTFYSERPGRWIGENEWPSDRIKKQKLYLQESRKLLEKQDTKDEYIELQSPLSVGLFAGKWCSYGATPDLPHDQREEDGGALIFDSEPLSKEFEILGAPKVTLEIKSNKPVAMIAARLSIVAPDGKATRVTYGVLNLSHRESSQCPSPLKEGTRYTVTIKLNDIAQKFPSGYRMRLSISTSYWPLVWPAPRDFKLDIYPKDSFITIPQRIASNIKDSSIEFKAPEVAEINPIEPLRSGTHKWRVIRDLETHKSTLEIINDNGLVYLKPIDLKMGIKALEWYSFQGDDYNSVHGETLWERSFKREGWDISTVTRTVLQSTPTHFKISAELDAYEGDKRVFSKNWDEEIPRDLV